MNGEAVSQFGEFVAVSEYLNYFFLFSLSTTVLDFLL